MRDEPAGGVDTEALIAWLQRVGPYAYVKITERAPGEFPAIDAAGRIAERLAEMTIEPLEIGEDRWKLFTDGILSTAQEILDPKVAAFDVRSVSAAREAMKRLGALNARSIEIMEILDLFGVNVGRKVADKAWQFGYACALGRVLLDPTGPRTLDEPAPVDDLAGVARSLFGHPPETWVGLRLGEPLSERVVLECITYATDEFFRRLYPLFGDDGEGAARVELRMLALHGFGLGRLQVEPSFAAHLRQARLLGEPTVRRDALMQDAEALERMARLLGEPTVRRDRSSANTSPDPHDKTSVGRLPMAFPEVPLGFLLGFAAGLLLQLGVLAAIATGLAGAFVAFLLPIPFGLISMHRGRAAAPVDLSVSLGPTTQADYALLSLASRNGVIARAVGRATDTPPETVARLLPELLGRQRVSNLATQRAASAVMAAVDPPRVDLDLYLAVLNAEVAIAAQMMKPRDDANRMAIEHNLGRPLTEAWLVEVVRTTVLARFGITIAAAIQEAAAGRLNLAFVVGVIRRAGEHYAREGARIR